jgi:hypothetical protein
MQISGQKDLSKLFCSLRSLVKPPLMNTNEQINQYINCQPPAKRIDMQAIHLMIGERMPGSRRWFLDGTDETGKTVTNPNIGYGAYTITYADGKAKEFYRIGLSANTTGISIYILGIDDKTYLPQTFGDRIGKATVTGYCIRFKKLSDIDIAVLDEAIRFGSAL